MSTDPFFRLDGAAVRSLENPSTPLSDPDDWLYGALGAARATSGVRVSAQTALTYAAFWRGVNLISRDVAKLPLVVYRRQREGGKAADASHPAYPLLLHEACPEEGLSAFQFRQVLQAHVLCSGNAYAYVERDGDATPVELWPLNPDWTYPVRENGRLWYVHQLPGGELRKLPWTDVLHVKGLGFDGLVGYSVIQKARESLGLALAQESSASVFFRNNAEPGVVLETPNKLSKETQDQLRETWERLHAGIENRHRTAVLTNGLTAKVIQMTARDSQFMESRQFQVRDVANWLSLPPHKLGDPNRTSYASLEQENQSYLDDCLDAWLVTWESECRIKLLTERQKLADSHHVLFLRSELLRANLQARGAYYVQALTNGWMCPDEVREEEGRNPIEGGSGKKFRFPLNQGEGKPAGGGGGPGGPAPDDTDRYFGPDEPAAARCGGQGWGIPGPCPAGLDQLHAEAKEKAKGLVERAKELPAKVWGAVKDKVKSSYKGLEAKYGRGWAIAIVAAGVVGTASPLPGGTILAAAPMIGAAKLYTHLAGKGARADDHTPELSVEEARRLGKEWMAALLADWKENDLPGLTEDDQ